MVNLSGKEALILEQLAERPANELYGLQMVRASGDQLKMGTIYVTLARLEQKGFVESRREENPEQTVPRRLYKITGAGAREFAVWKAAQRAMARAIKAGGLAYGS